MIGLFVAPIMAQQKIIQSVFNSSNFFQLPLRTYGDSQFLDKAFLNWYDMIFWTLEVTKRFRLHV